MNKGSQYASDVIFVHKLKYHVCTVCLIPKFLNILGFANLTTFHLITFNILNLNLIYLKYVDN